MRKRRKLSPLVEDQQQRQQQHQQQRLPLLRPRAAAEEGAAQYWQLRARASRNSDGRDSERVAGDGGYFRCPSVVAGKDKGEEEGARLVSCFPEPEGKSPICDRVPEYHAPAPRLGEHALGFGCQARWVHESQRRNNHRHYCFHSHCQTGGKARPPTSTSNNNNHNKYLKKLLPPKQNTSHKLAGSLKLCHLSFLLVLLSYSIITNHHPRHGHHVECRRQAAYPLPVAHRPTSQLSAAAGASNAAHHQSAPHNRPPRDSLAEFLAQQGGVIKDKNLTLTRPAGGGPIVIRRDIVIKRDAKLTIEPGVELLFERQRGIIVHGTLEILGHTNDRVKLGLLRTAPVNFRSQGFHGAQAAAVPYNAHQQQVRLVDGDLPSEGRVQLKLNDRWHSLCTNSKNLTSADIRVLCRQAGYQEGHWYRWFPRRNDTATHSAPLIVQPEAMAKSFHCSGSETSLRQCKRWSRMRAGGGICDDQSNIGVRCSRKLASSEEVAAEVTGEPPPPPPPRRDFWRGLEFVQAQVQQEYVLGGQMKQRVSKSRLEHLLISDAGLDEVGNATAAIRARGQPPRMDHIEIRNCVYGIVIEEAEDAIRLSNLRLTNNMGHPLFVNTSWGKVSLEGLHVENNGGDGIRLVRHQANTLGSHDFCKFANLGTSQAYPVVLSHEQQFLTQGRACCQEFVSQHSLTVHFPLFRSTPNNLLPEADKDRLVSVPAGVQLGRDARLVIYDDYRDEFPFRLAIRNESRPQSIVSKTGRLKICYEPASYRTVLFTLEVVADELGLDPSETDYHYGTGIAHDLAISNSFIRRNEGRGLWVDNPRSGVRLVNTTILEHNHLAGVHVENGTGQVVVQASRVANNTGHGLYLNLAGGYFHIDNSTISDNSLRGISIEHDHRPELVALNHTLHLGYSLLANNGYSALFLGNVCRSDAFWNVSMNSFIGNGDDAVVYQSCEPRPEVLANYANLSARVNTAGEQEHEQGRATGASGPLAPGTGARLQELHITHNVFLENQRRAIRMAPVFLVKCFIRHNLFKDHPLAVLYINNNNHHSALEGADFGRAGHSSDSHHHHHQAPVNIRVASNRFYANRGRYVANLGLLEDSPRQTLTFTKNYLEDNWISEPYAELRPRSRVSAVVVVSSSNAKLVRNRFDNPRSSFEMGAHLEAHSKVINATANFWGAGLDASAIYRRIFDRKNRYNLAQVEFLQYLLSNEDLEYITDLSFDRERDKITTYRNGTRLGGEVKGFEELAPDTYIVEDDIFVRPGGHLVLRPGTTLKFHDGVGIMVQGRLDALGKAHSQIHFTSVLPSSRLPQRAPVAAATTTSTVAPFANPWVSCRSDSGAGPTLAVAAGDDDDDYDEDVDLQPPPAPPMGRPALNSSEPLGARARPKRQPGASATAANNVRLSHTTMGRLEVQIEGVWGPVCEYNFDIHDAAVVCQQLGMIVNRDDWLLERFQYAPNDQQQQLHEVLTTDALMTNVRCDPALDTDITSCRAELSSRGDFDGTCNSEVGIRCFPPSWSGLRLGMGAVTSSLEHVTVQRAGMFDYAAYALKPAIQVDFNRHLLNGLTVRSNSDSGLGIMFSDSIGRHFAELAVNEGKFSNNERHGIELRSRGLTIRGCTMTQNRQNGLDYNPAVSERELDELLSWLRTPKNSDSVKVLTMPLAAGLGGSSFSVPSAEDSYRLFVIPRGPPADVRESFTLVTDPGHTLSAMLLAPIHPHSSEMLNMSLGANPESPVWDLRTNLTALPMVSPGYKFHFNYSSGPSPRGNIVLYVRSRFSNRDLKLLNKFVPAHLIMPKFDLTAAQINSKLLNALVITNCTLARNGVGLKFRYPNHAYTGGLGPATYNRRYSNETTNITSSLFEANYFSSVFVSSDELGAEPLADLEVPAMRGLETATSEIRFHLAGNRMRRNKDGVRQFSRDIRYSHNVFHWTINETAFEQNRGGGVNLVLPYFWRYDTNLSHTIELEGNTFLRNANFELAIEGHFAMLNLTRNTFRENRCRNRLIGFNGMEKRLLFRHNTIEHNTCNRLVDFNILSHADKMGALPTAFEFNTLRHNRRLLANSSYAALAANFRYPGLLAKLHPEATDYALALRGVQALNVTRNLFLNPELRFELVVAIVMDLDERTVNAAENFWGSVLADEIRERIFDFDDWNSFAMVEFSPFLARDSLQAATMLAEEQRALYQVAAGGGFGGAQVAAARFVSSGPQAPSAARSLQRSEFFAAASAATATSGYSRAAPEQAQPAAHRLAPLGGRLMRSLVLPHRREPYVVTSDWTVMPGVRLTIERGVTLEFMPNIGILVLGELLAAGSRDKPIQMRPLLSGADVVPLRSYLLPTKARPNVSQTGLGDPLSYEHNYALKHHQFTYAIDMGSVRVCKNEICHDGAHIYENNVEDPALRRETLDGYTAAAGHQLDGFLELFNMTTLQWVPVCDPLFTEHTARVVCRQLGLSHLSLHRRGRRWTIEQEQVSSVRHWPPSVQCEGDEANLASCPLAATGFMNHSTACHREGASFVYVYCRDFPSPSDGPAALAASGPDHQRRRRPPSNEHLHHWGGIRFSCPARQTLATDLNNFHHQAATTPAGGVSRLQHVVIDRAGLLHRKKAPAVQALQCQVHLEYVAVSNSAHHGLEVISSQANLNFHQLRLVNNLGLGLNFLSLTGSSSSGSAGRLVPYLPLKQLELSSDIFGLVDVCGANKEVRIEERLLLFYRYSSRPADCVKIISSKLPVKRLGLRMLQFNLFNSTHQTGRPDHVRVYDGSLLDRDSRLLVELGVEERHRLERPELRFYQSTDSTMTVRLHASGAGPQQGFIAELVTTPISYNLQRDLYNNLTLSELTGNKLGALAVASAGESTPNLVIRNNRFERNCLHLWANFSSCAAPLYMELQNCQRLQVANNLVRANQGGLVVKSYSHSAVAALDASIERNVFEANENSFALALLGPRTDPYQKANVMENFFTRNLAPYLSNVVLSRIVANFSGNILSGNLGKHQIEVVGFDKLPLSYQAFYNNWIYNNTATFERDQSTISGNSAGQHYHLNYLVNPDNHFEMSTKNWSRYDARPFQVPRDDELIHLASGDGSTRDVLRKTADSIPLSVVEAKRLDLYQASINARHNWWGFNASSAIQGRIRDRAQHEELISVDFKPFLETNSSLLSGHCSGGWHTVNGACLVYISTRMSYAEAREFCDRERATLPLLRGQHYEFTDFVASRENQLASGGPSGGSLVNFNQQFDPRVERIWVLSFDVSRDDACPAMNNYRTRNYDCQDRYAFLCQKNPQVVVSLLYWHRETGGLVALILALITLLLTCCCSACWAYKTRERRRESLERKNSLYRSVSLRSSNRALGQAAAALHSANSSNNSLSDFFLHRQLYNPDKANSITDLSASTQWTQPSSGLGATTAAPATTTSDLIRLDPSGGDTPGALRAQSRSRRSIRSVMEEEQQQQQRQQRQPSQPQRRLTSYKPQPSPPIGRLEPRTAAHHSSHVSQSSRPPTPASAGDAFDYSALKAPTPAPSIKEPHPRALGLMGSRTPSYAGSFTTDQQQQQNHHHQAGVVSSPMPEYERRDQDSSRQFYQTNQPLRAQPAPPTKIGSNDNLYTARPLLTSTPEYDFRRPPSIEPAPELSYRYSDIRFNPEAVPERRAGLPGGNSAGGSRQTIEDQDGRSSNSSAAPTNYSNQTFEESTNSYLEAYNNFNDAYGQNLLQRQINGAGDQISLVLTERSSITELIVNTKTTEVQEDYTHDMGPQLSQPAQQPFQEPYDQPENQVDPYGFPYQPWQQTQAVPAPPPPPLFAPPSPLGGSVIYQNSLLLGGANYKLHARAASDAGGAMMETSFDLHSPPPQQQQQQPMTRATFGGSQRLSSQPYEASNRPLGAGGDSKSGSRVYLETSFE